MTALPPDLLGILLALLCVAAPFAVVKVGLSGRFWSAVRRRPERALTFFEGDGAWLVLRDDDGSEDVGSGYDGPYLLELADGSDRIVFGRKGQMEASMRRYLRRMP